jgi:hypothetical protein
MRTIYLLTILLLGNYIFAQTIPNSSFETWTTVNLYEDPQGMFTSNLQSFISTHSPNLTKSTDKHSGNYAVKMETKINGSDTIVGMITNGSIVGNNIVGGIPYTTRVDSLSFYAKYNIQAGDSAAVLVLFKNNGGFLGMCMIKFSGSSTNYQYFSTPVNWMVPFTNPDTMMLIIVSSGMNSQPLDGSWTILDDIKLGSALIPGGGFETWIMHSSEDAVGWNSFNFASAVFPPPYATKTTDAYSGQYAMKITTKLINNNQDTLAHVTNGRILSDDFSGGMRVNMNPKKVTGYYKYTPVGFDSALVALRAYGFDNSGNYKNIDNNLIKLPAAGSYTHFEIGLNYTGWPHIDTLGIAFASSNIYDGHQWAKEGSVLIIDSLSIEYYPVGIAETGIEKQAKVYPNPASDIIHFDFDKNITGAGINIYDSRGVQVKSTKMNSNAVDISDLPTGLYFYEIVYQNKVTKGKISIKH